MAHVSDASQKVPTCHPGLETKWGAFLLHVPCSLHKAAMPWRQGEAQLWPSTAPLHAPVDPEEPAQGSVGEYAAEALKAPAAALLTRCFVSFGSAALCILRSPDLGEGQSRRAVQRGCAALPRARRAGGVS